MKVLDSKFVKDFIKMADDGYHEGWHERNGGNLNKILHKFRIQNLHGNLNL